MILQWRGFFEDWLAEVGFKMAHAHHAAHAYVHHIKVRKENSSQGDLKTKAMLSKAASKTENLNDLKAKAINLKIKILICISSRVSLKVYLPIIVKRNAPKIFVLLYKRQGQMYQSIL